MDFFLIGVLSEQKIRRSKFLKEVPVDQDCFSKKGEIIDDEELK